MKMNCCSICGKPARNGGLCEQHGKAYYDYNEEMKGVEDERQAINVK